MRILVIEDNSDIAANLGDYLEDRGHTVDFAADGVTGLHLAVVHDFDAIVLDLNLPGMDGIETLRHIKQMKPEIEVIMLTGHASVEFGLKGMQLGAFDYVMKPAPRNELLDTINQAYSKKRGLH